MHLDRVVEKRSIFSNCFANVQAELMVWTQQNTLRFATIQLKWKRPERKAGHIQCIHCLPSNSKYYLRGLIYTKVYVQL